MTVTHKRIEEMREEKWERTEQDKELYRFSVF